MLQEFLPIIINLFFIYLVITVIYLLLDNREPSVTIAWLIVFAAIPVVGFVAYLFVGRDRRWVRRSQTYENQMIEKNLVLALKSITRRQEEYITEFNRQNNKVYSRELVRLLYQSENSPLTSNNKVDIFYSGKEKFIQLKKDLKNAEHFIHFEYFIWRKDELTEEIVSILEQKVNEGVEVRILYDCFGSIFLGGRYIARLRKAGIKIYPYFNFLSPFKLHTINYRNHRKIVVIDGKVGYAGGMNMGQEYIDGGKRFPYWRDTHLRLEGEVVLLLQGTFAIDWMNTTDEKLFDTKYFPEVEGLHGYVPIQMAVSGPDTQWRSIQQMYFALITSAEKSVYIQSPYFVPDATVTAAIKTASLKGAEVKVMITGWADKKMPYWAAHTYFRELLESGVEIYLYTKGFMHAKAVAIDGEVASIGTANMDLRSFQVNYEQQVVMFDEEIAQNVEKQFAKDVEDCKRLTLDVYNKIPLIRKIRNSLARLFSPLL